MLKMLRFSFGVTRMDKITNEYMRGTAQGEQFEDKWFGHVQGRESGYTGQFEYGAGRQQKRGRPKR